MARYDGSPDAFPGVRDALPDLNVDRWPDPPAAADEEHDDWAEDDAAERVVDLRPPSDPADWATSYDTGSYTSSFTLETSQPPPPTPGRTARPTRSSRTSRWRWPRWRRSSRRGVRAR